MTGHPMTPASRKPSGCAMAPFSHAITLSSFRVCMIAADRRYSSCFKKMVAQLFHFLFEIGQMPRHQLARPISVTRFDSSIQLPMIGDGALRHISCGEELFQHIREEPANRP